MFSVILAIQESFQSQRNSAQALVIPLYLFLSA